MNIEQKIKKSIENEISYLKNIQINLEMQDSIKINMENIDSTVIPEYKGSFVYIISMYSKPNDNYLSEFDKIKEKGWAMCRKNPYQRSDTYNCLYVGSSKNIKKRLIEHLGIGGSSKTYALHLKQWLNTGIINIHIYKFDNNEKDIQLYEDLLWDTYKPLFGRQGKR